eukprot:TRINITY_DN32983_c0_g1_i1.p1 TRINITY_DN32983_c0_g1~~TRINITY_DN32983_c0_g1_i1.p1  ORF type:complete len:733 (+),score=54.49 TRINITY_DN32983_c0_g1_i1:78-2276(+)
MHPSDISDSFALRFLSGNPQSASCTGTLRAIRSGLPSDGPAVVVLAGLPSYFGPSSVVSLLASYVTDNSVLHLRLFASGSPVRTVVLALCPSASVAYSIGAHFDRRPVSPLDPERVSAGVLVALSAAATPAAIAASPSGVARSVCVTPPSHVNLADSIVLAVSAFSGPSSLVDPGRSQAEPRISSAAEGSPRSSAAAAAADAPNREVISSRITRLVFPWERTAGPSVCPVCLDPVWSGGDPGIPLAGSSSSDDAVDADKVNIVGHGGVVTTLCGHTFHGVCLAQWDDAPCPVCRFLHELDSTTSAILDSSLAGAEVLPSTSAPNAGPRTPSATPELGVASTCSGAVPLGQGAWDDLPPEISAVGPPCDHCEVRPPRALVVVCLFCGFCGCLRDPRWASLSGTPWPDARFHAGGVGAAPDTAATLTEERTDAALPLLSEADSAGGGHALRHLAATGHTYVLVPQSGVTMDLAGRRTVARLVLADDDDSDTDDVDDCATSRALSHVTPRSMTSSPHHLQGSGHNVRPTPPRERHQHGSGPVVAGTMDLASADGDRSRVGTRSLGGTSSRDLTASASARPRAAHKLVELSGGVDAVAEAAYVRLLHHQLAAQDALFAQRRSGAETLAASAAARAADEIAAAEAAAGSAESEAATLDRALVNARQRLATLKDQESGLQRALRQARGMRAGFVARARESEQRAADVRSDTTVLTRRHEEEMAELSERLATVLAAVSR